MAQRINSGSKNIKYTVKCFIEFGCCNADEILSWFNLITG